MNFKLRAKTLLRKMSECADGISAEDLLAAALEKAYNDGIQHMNDLIEELLRRKRETDESRSKEN